MNKRLKNKTEPIDFDTMQLDLLPLNYRSDIFIKTIFL